MNNEYLFVNLSIPVKVSPEVVIGGITTNVIMRRNGNISNMYEMGNDDCRILREKIFLMYNIPISNIGFVTQIKIDEDDENIAYINITEAYYYNIPKDILRSYIINNLLK